MFKPLTFNCLSLSASQIIFHQVDDKQIDKIYFELDAHEHSGWEAVGDDEHLEDSSDEETRATDMTKTLMQAIGKSKVEQKSNSHTKVVVGKSRSGASHLVYIVC